MSFSLIHISNVSGGPGEEAYVLVPHGEKAAVAVPIDAVGLLARIVHEAVGDLGRPQCQACGVDLPAGRDPGS